MTKMKKNVTFTAVFMACAVLLAKACGMLRDMAIASLYGTGMNAVAFSTASRIPLLFFDIALGSAVTSAFIPVFNEYLAKGEKERAIRFSNCFITLVVLITLIMSAAGMIFSHQFITLIAGGLDAQTHALSVVLVQILFPTIIFTGLAYCFVGILQSFGEFTVPAIISLVSNGLLIAYLFVIGDRFGVQGIAIAMLIAWSGQCIVQFPSLKKLGYTYRPTLKSESEGIKKVCKLALPIIISTWMQPINTMININLASGLNGGQAIAALDYANKLYIILVGVFTFTVTNLIFPSLSRASATQDKAEFTSLVARAIRYVLFLITPIMVGFLLMSTPIIRLFYERGEFTADSTAITATALFFYSLGMLGYGLQEIANKAFYALQDGKTPMKVAMGGIVVNIALSILFVSVLQVGLGGLALSASIAANLTGFFLIWKLHRSCGKLLDRNLIVYFVKILVIVAVMGVGVYGAKTLTASLDAGKVLSVALPVCVGAILYGAGCLILRIPELTDLVATITAKLKRN
ncbi:MAG: murein biosynthesis integral membrane protein MurJ [Ruminococcaceae bacterium]|nr:murein biosynthesis integral membrane protein MurJ [Oscillospiraceae bacterium]